MEGDANDSGVYKDWRLTTALRVSRHLMISGTNAVNKFWNDSYIC
jgi:hypothetical protein